MPAHVPKATQTLYGSYFSCNQCNTLTFRCVLDHTSAYFYIRSMNGEAVRIKLLERHASQGRMAGSVCVALWPGFAKCTKEREKIPPPTDS